MAVQMPPLFKDSTGQEIKQAIQGLTPVIPDFISDAFSVERSYSKGDITIYNNNVYEFTANKSAGAWDSTKVTQTTIGAVCTSLNNSLTKSSSTIDVVNGTQNMNLVEKWGSMVHFSLQLSSMTGITGNSTVGTLPSGYKPKNRFKTVGFGTFGGSLTALAFAIETDGTIVANHGSSALTTCLVEATFVVA